MNVLAESPVAKVFKRQGALEGRKKGREEGRREGRIEGFLEAVIVSLDVRFGKERRESLESELRLLGTEKLKQVLEAIHAGRSFAEVRAVARAA